MNKTKISMLNIVTSIIPSFIIIIIGFLKFKFFIGVYGDDLNGVVSLVTQIYAYLSLAELGFGAATNLKLYKYFQEKNEKKISEVFNESKRLYFNSGMFIFISGILISIILPLFIKNNTVSQTYIISIMALYAVDFLADYLYGLPYRNLLIVNEKIYIINLVKTSQQIIFKILELILIINHVNLILVICLSVIANLIGSFVLVRIAKKQYPFLKKYKGRDKTVTKSVKDIVVNNISDIVNEKTDSIIIANQMGLKDTSIYSMYNLIVNYLYMFILNFVNGIKASIGATVNNDRVPKKEGYRIFKQFILAMDFICIVCFITFVASSSSFMSIFINESYYVSKTVVILFGSILWINVMLKSLHVIVEVKGYFKDIKWLTLAQAISNIILSLILVKYLGLAGVLLATFITSILLTVPVKANVAFKEFGKNSTFFYNISITSVIISSILLYIIKVLGIYNNIDNLLYWFIITGIVFVMVALVTFGILYALYVDFRALFKRFINLKIIFKIKRFILAHIAYIYYSFKVKNKNIKVYDIDKTLDDIIKNKASLIRYGDGEMDLINGKSLKFQKYDEKLSKRLDEILKIKSNKELYIAIPPIFNGLDMYIKDEKEFWAISLLKTYKNWDKHCTGEYYNAFVSRPYMRYKDKTKCKNHFEKIKKIYENRNVIIVEGEYSRLGVGNDLFNKTKSLKRILCPTKNAYELYNKILDEILKQKKDNLILLSLGPTAKILAYDLYKEGYQVIDLGHIDLEYEWYLKKDLKKTKIANKYVNEIDDNDPISEVKDQKYQREILINLNEKQGEKNEKV